MSRESRRNLKEAMLNDAIEHYNINFDYLRQDNLKMALLRLYNIEKEFRDSVTRYKSSWYVWRDLLQPFEGLYQIVRGVVQIIGFPLFALVMMIGYGFAHLCGTADFVDTFDRFKQVIRDIADTTLGVVTDGFAQVIHGLVQVVKAPFTWFFQLPFRSALTAHRGWKSLGDNAGMNALVDKYEALLETSNDEPLTTDVLDILFRVQEKYKKAIHWRDQECNIKNPHLEESTEKLVKSIPEYNKPKPKGKEREDTRTKFERRDNFVQQTSVTFLFGERVRDIDPKAKLSAEGVEHATAMIKMFGH